MPFSLTITLSPAEVAALILRRKTEGEPIEDVLHRALGPLVEADAEKRLDEMATKYRTLTADQQFELLQILADWAQTESIADPIAVPDITPVVPMSPANSNA